MIHVQHLLGIGQLRRAAQLASALAQVGHDVHLVSGGRSVPDLQIGSATLHQLAPLKSTDATYKSLVDDNDNVVDDEWMAERRQHLLEIFASLNPDALVTETFPFGRRMLRHELIPLLQIARSNRSKTMIISSVRDILQPKSKPGRNEEILGWLDSYYHKVIVHSDPAVSTMSDTFTDASDIEQKCFYSGYVSDAPMANNAQDGADEVIVSGGGGAASLTLLKTAIEARPLTKLKGSVWRILVGHNIDQETFLALQNSAAPGIVVERNRSDFFTLLTNCKVSVSQAGYNTVMDVLRSGVKSVLVPFSKSDEVEQTLRAKALQRRGCLTVVAEDKLDPYSLAKGIDSAVATDFTSVDFRMNGAEESARLIGCWLDEWRSE